MFVRGFRGNILSIRINASTPSCMQFKSNLFFWLHRSVSSEINNVNNAITAQRLEKSQQGSQWNR